MTTQQTAEPRGTEPVRISLDALDAEVSTGRLRIGQGFNSVSGMQGIMNAVDYSGKPHELEPEGEDGQRSYYVFKSVRDYRELQTELQITASAQLGFGVYSGDAAASYSRTERHTELDTFLLVGVTVRNPTLVLKRALLSRAARQLAKNGQSDFVTQCGDSYVYGKITGGDLLGVVRYRAETYELSEKLRIEVNAAAAKWKAGMSMSEAKSEIHTFSSVEYSLLRDGGLGDIPDLDHLIQASYAYPESVRDQSHPVTIKYLIRGYQTVEMFPLHKINLAKLRNHSRLFSEEVFHLNDAWERKNELQYVEANLGEYEIDGDPHTALETLIAKVNSNIELLQQSASRFVDSLDAVSVDLGPLPSLPPKRLPYIVELYRGNDCSQLAYRTRDNIHNFQDVAGDINDQIISMRVNGNPSEYAVDLFVDADYRNGHVTYVSPFSGNIGFPMLSQTSSLAIRRL